MSQFPCLLEKYTISYHINHLSSYSNILFDINECINIFGINHLLDKYPNQLSGGELTRVAFVLCILKDRDVYLFDEPTSGLDKKYILLIREYIDKLLKLNKCVIISTHESLLINHADLLYAIKNHQISQVKYKNNNYLLPQNKYFVDIKRILKMYKPPHTKFFYKSISLFLSLLIGFCSYSYCFDNTLESIQKNQLNQFHSTEIRVGKEQDNVDMLNVGGNKVLTQSELDIIKSIDHIVDIEWRYDNPLVPTAQNDITETTDLYTNIPFSIYKGNEKIYETNDVKGNLYTYVNEHKFVDDIKEEYCQNGVYLSRNFLISNGLLNTDLKDCYIKFKLSYPLYNTSGRWKTGDANDPSGQTFDCNVYTVSLTDVVLPISGILKNDSFGVKNVFSYGTLYVERSTIEKLIKEKNIKQDRTLYITKNGYYVNNYPKDKQNEIIDTYVDTVWQPTAYSIFVDDVTHINQVAKALRDEGFVIESEYYDNQGFVSATALNQKTMVIIATIILLIIIIFGTIMQYINRNDYYNISNYYHQEMIDKRDIIKIILSLCFRNCIKRIFASLVTYSILMLIINQLVVSYTSISFTSIGIIFILSFIIEFIIPYLFLRKKYTND